MTDQSPEALKAVADMDAVLTGLKLNASTVKCDIYGPMRRFYLALGPGEKIKKIESFSQEIAMGMRAASAPVILPNREGGILDNTVKLTLMTAVHPVVPFAPLVGQAGFANKAVLDKFSIPLLLGTTEIDRPLVVDLHKMPHLLIAGGTGSGKSMLLHAIIQSVITHSKAQGIRLCLLDPKLVEFVAYENSDALRYSVANTVDQAKAILDDLQITMEKRFTLLAKNGCRDILEYRAANNTMPFIVLVIDELVDFMRDAEFATKLCALAERGRAAGIHAVAATQHPSREVITGLLKAQFPARISCKVATQTHSRVVLDQNGAEKLLGNGDSLLLDSTGDLKQFKGALVQLPQRVVKSKKKADAPKKEDPNRGADLASSLLGLFELMTKKTKRRKKRK